MNQLNVLMLGPSLEQNGGIATLEKLIIKHEVTHTKIHHINTHDEGSISYRVIVFGKSLAIFLWKLSIQKIDVVHIHISDGGSILRKAILCAVAFIFNKPVLMHTNGAEFHVTYAKLPQRAQQILSKVFQRCQGFIVLSESWQDYYVSNLGLTPKQVIILPNPSELATQVPDRKNRTQISLVCCGRIGQRKGTFDLIEAFANLSDNQRKCTQLVIAGDGEIEKAQQLAASLNLADQVTFLGWINSEKRDEVLSQADVFILPSYNEGLPLAILEAMGWGLPVISTPVGGISELVVSNQNGLLVTPGDIQQLSEAMKLLIENETLRLSLGSVARKTVEPFDIKNYSIRLADIYHSLSKQNLGVSS
ncbi:glycosyltransferase family 4 protein [Nostoc sp. UHCC 0251]|uniref:glycosyltransferase family 4 protein n=1 Tax=Nostoc sp. UHCC 0251 TaxID=3110240 RepID=UPI002B1EE73E|nr:glycosyltransferase family 4 protein [Nostoc sp. UHCC 0251]MEA5622830.1 glycosyltransferase family 4 protein [Nostoc sp. UHCC 0251]